MSRVPDEMGAGLGGATAARAGGAPSAESARLSALARFASASSRSSSSRSCFFSPPFSSCAGVGLELGGAGLAPGSAPPRRLPPLGYHPRNMYLQFPQKFFSQKSADGGGGVKVTPSVVRTFWRFPQKCATVWRGWGSYPLGRG